MKGTTHTKKSFYSGYIYVFEFYLERKIKKRIWICLHKTKLSGSLDAVGKIERNCGHLEKSKSYKTENRMVFKVKSGDKLWKNKSGVKPWKK